MNDIKLPDTVKGRLHFLPTEFAGGPLLRNDLREPAAGGSTNGASEVLVTDARDVAGLGLHESGFELVSSPSAVKNFYDCDEVIATYYAECNAIAARLTWAHIPQPYEHLIR